MLSEIQTKNFQRRQKGNPVKIADILGYYKKFSYKNFDPLFFILNFFFSVSSVGSVVKYFF
jgi:hypothetical protein